MKKILGVLLLGLLIAGCSSRPKVEDDAAALRQAALVDAPETFVFADPDKGGPVITVLEQGAEPRRALRYVFQPGQADTMVFDMIMNMKTSMAGMSLMDIKMPLTRMKAALDIAEVARDGSCRYRARYFAIDVIPDEDTDPNFMAVYEPEIRKMVGLEVNGVITARGHQPQLETVIPEGMPPDLQGNLEQMEQSMQNMAVPFPQEALGLGAQWSVFMPVDVNNLKGSQTATYELMEWMKDGVRLSLGLLQDFPAQSIQSPDLPEGTTVSLENCDSSVQGFMTVDFLRLVPQAGMVSDMLMDTVIDGMGMTQQMQMEMQMDVNIYGAEMLP